MAGLLDAHGRGTGGLCLMKFFLPIETETTHDPNTMAPLILVVAITIPRD